MASAYAKFTGELGVCIATSGPGASHLLTGLYDARMDHMPVLAIAGQQARTAIGGHYQQELDLQTCSRTWPAPSCRQAMVPPQVRHLVDRGIRTALARAQDHRADLPQRSAGPALRGAAAQARHGPFGRRLPAPEGRALRRRSAARRRRAQRRQEGRHAGRRRRAAGDRRGDRGGRQARGRRRQGAARQGRAARRSALGDRLDRPARHRGQLQADDRMRHAADGRLGLSLFRVPAQGRAGARRADRHQGRHAVDPLSRWRSISSATPPRPCKALLPLLEAEDRPLLARDGREECRGLVEDARGPRACSRPARSIRSASPGNCRRACRTASSSPATPAPAPTGMRAT